MLRKTISSDVVVIGGGVAGCSAFNQILERKQNHHFKAILVDELPPMSLTSARGTFSYRNWWPDAKLKHPMMKLVSHSIDLLEKLAVKTDNSIEMSRNGYLFLSRDEGKITEFQKLALQNQENGGGELRMHVQNLDHYEKNVDPSLFLTHQIDLNGADLIVGEKNIKKVFPFVTSESKVNVALHVRRCGFINSVALGKFQIDDGLRISPASEVMRGKVVEIHTSNGEAVTGVSVISGKNEITKILTDKIVVAAGPQIQQVLQSIDVYDKKVFHIPPTICELHGRAIFRDYNSVFNNLAPLTFDSDPVGVLKHSDDDDEIFSNVFPPGVHVRPYNDSQMMAIWTYDNEILQPLFPAKDYIHPKYGEICVRGLYKLFPQLRSETVKHSDIIKTLDVDGGYYCKAPDNCPLIGPLCSSLHGLYLHGALSGIGLMSSAAAGELIASHVLDPSNTMSRFEYSEALLPSRFKNSEAIFDRIAKSGQM